MSIIFFTGFPGFLGSELLPQVLEPGSDGRAACLVQPKFLPQAHARLRQIEADRPDLRNRIELVEGDITCPGLGMANATRIAPQVEQVFHLAAVYDLSVQRNLAVDINVQGTRNLLDFATTCPNLRRLHYVSTCYVSGRCPGRYLETDLDKGQSFNNFYEETKYLAEVEVQSRMRSGLPTTIYRPAIVVGDSRSGATQKYDGPYFVIRWVLRQPRLAVMPVVGQPAVTRVNLVPRDYVVAAILWLSRLQKAQGKVYQLADPDPLTVEELIQCIARAAHRTVLRVPLSVELAKFAIDRIPGVYRLMQIPSSAIDYFVHPTEYDCSNTTTDLAGSGVTLPPMADCLGAMVDFVRRHPEVGSQPMV